MTPDIKKKNVVCMDHLIVKHEYTGSGFKKNNQTTKQLDNSIWADKKVETKFYLLPIGPNKFV